MLPKALRGLGPDEDGIETLRGELAHDPGASRDTMTEIWPLRLVDSLAEANRRRRLRPPPARPDTAGADGRPRDQLPAGQSRWGAAHQRPPRADTDNTDLQQESRRKALGARRQIDSGAYRIGCCTTATSSTSPPTATGCAPHPGTLAIQQALAGPRGSPERASRDCYRAPRGKHVLGAGLISPSLPPPTPEPHPSAATRSRRPPLSSSESVQFSIAIDTLP